MQRDAALHAADALRAKANATARPWVIQGFAV
jgi:hypothetical protein